ncbi:MAG: YidH family protein [Thermoleophilia bacterium]
MAILRDSPDDGHRLAESSRARDHMANERTYLAWVRTGLTVMVVGLAIAKFVDDGAAHALAAGLVLIGAGALSVVEGSRRYRRINREIEGGRYVTGTLWAAPVIATAGLMVAVAVALVLLLV